MQGNFFSEFKTERTTTRNEALAQIDELLASTSTDTEVKKQAQKEKLEITQSMEKEVTIEGLLNARGFGNAVVTVHTNSVNVVIGASTLTQAQVAQIVDIVERESGESPENIKIMPVG